MTGESITGRVLKLSGAWWSDDKGMRCKGLAAEERAIVGDWGFKALGVDASIWKVASFFALFSIADACDRAQDVSEPTAEDIAFVGWHLQRFFDGVSEAVLCETEVLKHGKG